MKVKLLRLRSCVLLLSVIVCGAPGCGRQSESGKTPSVTENQEPDTAETVAAKDKAKAELSEFINSVSDPQIKEQLTVGLKLIEKMSDAESISLSSDLLKQGVYSLETTKNMVAAVSLFAVKGDPNAASLNWPEIPTSFGLAETATVSKPDWIKMLEAWKVLLTTQKKSGFADRERTENFFLGMLSILNLYYNSTACVKSVMEQLGGTSCADKPTIQFFSFGLVTLSNSILLNKYVAPRNITNSHILDRLPIIFSNANDEIVKALLANPNLEAAKMTSWYKAYEQKLKDLLPSPTIGGTLSGLNGGTVTLALNGGNNLDIAANGTFTFTSEIAEGNPYAVTVATQPAGQNCSVASGSGTTTAASVTNIAVSCTGLGYKVSGNVSGLTSGTLTLQLNSGNNLNVTANGAFQFTADASYGAPYTVGVFAQPAGRTCSITNGTGTTSGDVTNVAIACTTNNYPISANVSGLTSSGSFVLRLNGANDLTVSTIGVSQFTPSLAYGATYTVSVFSHPVGQTCTAGAVSGPVNATSNSVNITCSATTHSLSGTVSGLGNTGVSSIRLNNTPLTVTADVSGNARASRMPLPLE